MKLTIDKLDDGTCYADLEYGESLTDAKQRDAIRYARKHNRAFVEVWQRVSEYEQRFVRLMLVAEAA